MSMNQEMIGKWDGEFLSAEVPPMTLSCQEIGWFGKMRNQYLKENKPDLLTELVFENKISQHLAEVDQAARNRWNQIVAGMMQKHPAPDKQSQPVEWAGYMKTMEVRATEIVLQELIYN